MAWLDVRNRGGLMYSIGLPSGIGDVSWAYSKLKALGKQNYLIADGWPHRTVPFMNLLPQVATADYGQFNYQDILTFEAARGIEPTTEWKKWEAQGLTHMLMQPNRHLEMGRRLEDWCHDLPTDFHYDINIPKEDAEKAHRKLETFKKPWT